MKDKFFEKIGCIPKMETEAFLKLSRRSQEMVFEQITREDGLGYLPFSVCGLPEDIQSPIEQMFYIAFCVINYEYFGGKFLIERQAEIIANGKRRFADFLFSTKFENGFCEFDNYFELVIECDGHEFHKLTKQQVKNDNERDLELKKAGYDIIHFSGSQLYENAWKCAYDVCSYIQRKVFKEGNLCQ